jgi:hypothetical protein
MVELERFKQMWLRAGQHSSKRTPSVLAASCVTIFSLNRCCLGRRFALDALSKRGMITHRRFHVVFGPCPLRLKKRLAQDHQRIFRNQELKNDDSI